MSKTYNLILPDGEIIRYQDDREWGWNPQVFISHPLTMCPFEQWRDSTITIHRGDRVGCHMHVVMAVRDDDVYVRPWLLTDGV